MINYTNNINNKIHFSIIHHASLFALISKKLIQKFGTNAEKVLKRAVKIYGNQRGNRMALRVKKKKKIINAKFLYL